MNFNLLRAAVVLLLAIASQAWAFTSTHPSLYLRGSHNGWGSTPMVLVGDNQWQLDASFSGSSRSFKFDVFANWSENYGDNNNDKIADRSGGNINVPSDGNWRIRYNDKTRAYSLTLADANVLPIANAGPDQTVTAGATVQFNGSQSSDPDGSIASFSWSNGLTGAQPSLRYDLPGSYEVRLTVTDNKGGSSSDVMQLTVQAADNSFTKVWPSVALRGTFNAWGSSPMSLVANNLWQLDANFTGSSRTFKFDLYSNWSENYGDNNSDGIAERSGNNINVPSDGNWRITINDQTRAYTVVKLSGSNQPPLANAGADFSVVKGSPAQFDGSQSSDPDGSIVSYSWSNGLSGVKPSFTYTTEGQYPVTLTVTDDKGATASDVVTVTVTDGLPVYSKLLPSLYLRGTHNGWGGTAMKLVDNNIWQGTATFDGSATARFKFDVYANWSEDYGDSNKDFIAERSGGDIYPSQGAGEYRIRFNDKSRIYSLEKVVVNALPLASAGPDQTVTAGETVWFEGGGSSDSDGVIVTYQWSNGLQGVRPNKVYDTPGVYEVTLLVTDNAGGTASDAMQLTVLADDDAANCAVDLLSLGDADGDGLPDCAELPGISYQGLEFHYLGARRDVRDFFVEVDWMNTTDLGVIPQREALEMVRDAFARNGMAIHFDVGDLFHQAEGLSPADFDLGGGNAVPFNKYISIHNNGDPTSSLPLIKAANMDAARINNLPFYYMLFASSQNVNGNAGSSGVAWVFGKESIISLGQWGLSRNSATATNYLINYQAGTVMHEFGHNLSLWHGGADSVNYKPNYLSVMNYSFQLTGLPTEGEHELSRYFIRKFFGNALCGSYTYDSMPNPPSQDYRNYRIDYSHGESLAFNEADLNEALGLGRPQSVAQDLNCDGVKNGVGLVVDLNSDSQTSTLHDHDDWGQVRHYFAANGAAAAKMVPQVAEETAPSAEFFLRLREELLAAE